MKDPEVTKSKMKKRCKVHSDKVLWAIQSFEKDMINYTNHRDADLLHDSIQELERFIIRHDEYREILVRTLKLMQSTMNSMTRSLDV